MIKDKVIKKITQDLKNQIQSVPDIGVILGSGWGDVISMVENPIILSYSQIKGMPKCSVPGHSGNFVFGKIAGKYVCFMQGRFHYYEYGDLDYVTLPIKIMKSLGVKQLLLTNSAGCVHDKFNVGDLVIIDDHINLTGLNPLIKLPMTDADPIFIDMSEPYDKRMSQQLLNSCNKVGMTAHVGVYAQVTGPSYETRAEVKALEKIGVDCVAMSLGLEVIYARYLHIKCAGVSLITNVPCAITHNALSHKEVVENAKKQSDKLSKVLLDFITEV